MTSCQFGRALCSAVQLTSTPKALPQSAAKRDHQQKARSWPKRNARSIVIEPAGHALGVIEAVVEASQDDAFRRHALAVFQPEMP